MATTDPGIFAAGDIREGSPSYVAAAIGDGITAGLHAVAYVLGQK